MIFEEYLNHAEILLNPKIEMNLPVSKLIADLEKHGILVSTFDFAQGLWIYTGDYK